MPDIPAEAVQAAAAVDPALKAILDERAGKTHNDDGPVMSCLEEILDLHAAQVRRVAAEQIRTGVHGAVIAANGRLGRNMRGLASTVLAIADEIENPPARQIGEADGPVR